MISRIEALNYRCLRYVSQRLERFHVLVGPNASGKTTFFNVVEFLGTLLEKGLQDAVRSITPSPRDLLFNHNGEKFELAVEAEIPAEVVANHPLSYRIIRYEISIRIDRETEIPSIDSEYLGFVSNVLETQEIKSLFPDIYFPPDSIMKLRKSNSKSSQSKVIASKNSSSAKDNFYPEFKRGKGGGWVPSFQLGNQRSAFANLPEDEERFPAATWFKSFLTSGIQKLELDSSVMKYASPPGHLHEFSSDGSALPWVIQNLKDQSPDQFSQWIEHLKCSLEDLKTITTVLREDTRNRHLVIVYESGVEVPSWVASDGTLRLLALTLPTYLVDFSGVLLIEEPENGIHPSAIEIMLQSLSSIYDAQVLLATHSPIILSCTELEDVLCFAKNEAGATDVIIGSNHPRLQGWKKHTPLGDLFAAGVLS